MTDTDNSDNPAPLLLAEQIERSIAERIRGRADMERLIHERAEDPAGLVFYWLPFFPEWSLLESAFLLFGRNPNHFKGKDAPPCVDNLYRVMQQKCLPDPIRPIDAARWFQEQFGAHYDLPPALAALLAESPASEPVKQEKPRLSNNDILALRQQGLSNERIHREYSVPKDRITRVNQSKGVNPLTPGPKPKVSD